MLFVLGVGSNIAMTSCVMTVIRDQFPNVKAWHAASGVTLVGLLIGLVYVTPVNGRYKNLKFHVIKGAIIHLGWPIHSKFS